MRSVLYAFGLLAVALVAGVLISAAAGLASSCVAAPRPASTQIVGWLEGDTGNLVLVIERSRDERERVTLVFESQHTERLARKIGFGVPVRVNGRFVGQSDGRHFFMAASVVKD